MSECNTKTEMKRGRVCVTEYGVKDRASERKPSMCHIYSLLCQFAYLVQVLQRDMVSEAF